VRSLVAHTVGAAPRAGSFTRTISAKWPSAVEVLADWTKIAAEFDFLELEAALMSGEGCEDDTTVAVVYNVSNGVVTAHGPDYPLFERFGVAAQDTVSDLDITAKILTRLNSPLSRENHYTIDQIKAMVTTVKTNRAQEQST